MEYMLFIVEDPAHFADFTKDDWEVLDERHRSFVRSVEAAGASIIVANQLGPEPAERFTPQPGGEVLVTRGPFAETAEVILGYYHLQVTDEDQARGLARICPTAGWVEVRRVGA